MNCFARDKDEFGDLVSAKLGLSEFVEDDEPSDPAQAALIGEAGKEKVS
jgi:hypothetical protein